MTEGRPVFVFDLDGTLVDSVYQHVVAWSAALRQAGLDLSVWKIHRRIGMSGGLIAHALLREAGRELDEAVLRQVQETHTQIYLESLDPVRPLPGARQLLDVLTERGAPWTIATSGRPRTAQPVLDLVGVPEGTSAVTRDQVAHAKPDPTCFWRQPAD